MWFLKSIFNPGELYTHFIQKISNVVSLKKKKGQVILYVLDTWRSPECTTNILCAEWYAQRMLVGLLYMRAFHTAHACYKCMNALLTWLSLKTTFLKSHVVRVKNIKISLSRWASLVALPYSNIWYWDLNG